MLTSQHKSELYQSFRDKKAERTVNIDSVHVYNMMDEIEQDENEENKQRLIRCIGKLKEEDVQLIEMRFFEKRSFKEIGEILDITENNAKVKSFRALEKLKKIFINRN